MKRLMLAVVLVVGSQSASARDFYSGNKMLEFCRAGLTSNSDLTAEDAVYGPTCFGFAAGINDSQSVFVAFGAVHAFWCMPEGVSLSQLARVIVKYMEEHPEELHFAAGDLAAHAFMDTFPCE